MLKAHAGAVRSVCFSSDSKYLLTAGDDKAAKVGFLFISLLTFIRCCQIWNLQGQRFVASLLGHSNWVRSARFSPDSRLAVTGGDDKTVKVWDVHSHNCIHTFYEHTAYAAVVVLPCAHLIVCVSFSAVNCVRFHPTGAIVAACSADNSIKLWSGFAAFQSAHHCCSGTFAPRRCCSTTARTRPRSTASISTLRATSSSQLLTIRHSRFHCRVAACCSHYVVARYRYQIWDLREGHQLYTIHAHKDAALAAAFSITG